MPAPVAVYVVAAIAGVAAVIAFKEVPFSFTFLIRHTPFHPLSKHITDPFSSSSSNPTLHPPSIVGQRIGSKNVVLDAGPELSPFLCPLLEGLGMEIIGTAPVLMRGKGLLQEKITLN
jgi:hypothetical protein